jgi:L,D-transpeptidase catalytic domain
MSAPQTPDQGDTERGKNGRPSRFRRLLRRIWAVLALLAAGILAAQIAAAVRTNRADSYSPPRPSLTARPSSGPSSSPTPTVVVRERKCEKPTLIGTIIVDSVVARADADPDGNQVAVLNGKNRWGVPQVLDLLNETRGTDGNIWFKALLPLRPNGTKGYVPAKALSLTPSPYRLVLNRDRYELLLYKGCKRIRRFPVGIGTGETPTPVGRFYLNVLLKPPDPNTIYGTYAYGLSAFSDVLVNWRGGGVVGLHGTNQPWSIGKESSHGCIRMYNSDINELAKFLPLGTPITIN